jgi:hypothetical protein
MTDDGMRGPQLVRDDELTTHLRALMAPPAEEGYWDALERRIMARIERAQDEGRWWVLTPRATQVALLAAGIALILAGSIYLRSQAVEATMAYETVIEAPGGSDRPVFAQRGALDERRATMRAATGH